jgi:5'-3' exonuclease
MSATPLLLCDSHHLAFRSHYGFPARITSRDKQRDLTCIFGFFALLRAGIRDNLSRPAEILAVFDGENGTAKRKAVDPGYKANRPEGTPAPIKSLAEIKRGLDACGIRWIEIGDEEADDVIAALAAHADGRPIVIMSGDKDYYQLLSEHVSILNTARRAGQRIIGPVDIKARYGITASQWCDFRALAGDPSDGLPGIRGIGSKTAAALLEGGTGLEKLRDSAALTGCRRQAVTANWDKLLAWRDIIRLNDKVPLGAAAVTGQPTAPMPRAAEILDALGLW